MASSFLLMSHYTFIYSFLLLYKHYDHRRKLSVWLVSGRLAYFPPVHTLQFEKFLKVDKEFTEFVRVCFKLRPIMFTKGTQIKSFEEQSVGTVFRVKQLEQH
jgi:hypothetical protein